jgi:hypothetical protein
MTTKTIKIGKTISLANIAKPKVELKNVHFGYSREWGPMGRFDADLWINGIKCLKAIDEGNGGCIDYEYYTYNNPKANEVQANIKLLESYIKTLPKTSLGGVHEGGKLVMFTMDMDLFINSLLDKREKDKAQKKLQKLFVTAIVFGNDKGYRMYNFNQPLTTVPKATIQQYYMQAKGMCKKDEIILNTNLKELGINL